MLRGSSRQTLGKERGHDSIMFCRCTEADKQDLERNLSLTIEALLVNDDIIVSKKVAALCDQT